uniref:Disease resistance protein winged helix domain-containing protein n=1 Tax=Fagus sylvatica TaxID=28930 RepID=A0A2N9IE44_FAGSY
MDAEDKSSSNDLRVIFEGIQKDLNYIKKACCNLKDWEDLVNKDIRKLAWTMPSKKEQEKLTAFKTILRLITIAGPAARLFPENAIIKKKVLVHWWVGEGFIDSLNSGEKTAESTGNEFIKEFIRKGIIEPVHKKRRPKSDSCKMHPSIRHAVIELSRRAGFVDFTSKGNPTADFSYCRRACLVKTEEGSSLLDL